MPLRVVPPGRGTHRRGRHATRQIATTPRTAALDPRRTSQRALISTRRPQTNNPGPRELRGPAVPCNRGLSPSGCPKLGHAMRPAYSWIAPPSRSRRIAYVETGDLHRIGEGWTQRSGVCHALMRPMGVVEMFERPTGVEQLSLIPDCGAVQQWLRCVDGVRAC